MMFEWLKDRYQKKLKKKKKESSIPYVGLEYDEYLAFIEANCDNSDVLEEIATGIGLSNNLTQVEKDVLWDYIEDCKMRRRD